MNNDESNDNSEEPEKPQSNEELKRLRDELKSQLKVKQQQFDQLQRKKQQQQAQQQQAQQQQQPQQQQQKFAVNTSPQEIPTEQNKKRNRIKKEHGSGRPRKNSIKATENPEPALKKVKVEKVDRPITKVIPIEPKPPIIQPPPVEPSTKSPSDNWIEIILTETKKQITELKKEHKRDRKLLKEQTQQILDSQSNQILTRLDQFQQTLNTLTQKINQLTAPPSLQPVINTGNPVSPALTLSIPTRMPSTPNPSVSNHGLSVMPVPVTPMTSVNIPPPTNTFATPSKDLKLTIHNVQYPSTNIPPSVMSSPLSRIHPSVSQHPSTLNPPASVITRTGPANLPHPPVTRTVLPQPTPLHRSGQTPASSLYVSVPVTHSGNFESPQPLVSGNSGSSGNEHYPLSTPPTPMTTSPSQNEEKLLHDGFSPHSNSIPEPHQYDQNDQTYRMWMTPLSLM